MLFVYFALSDMEGGNCPETSDGNKLLLIESVGFRRGEKPVSTLYIDFCCGVGGFGIGVFWLISC